MSNTQRNTESTQRTHKQDTENTQRTHREHTEKRRVAQRSTERHRDTRAIHSNQVCHHIPSRPDGMRGAITPIYSYKKLSYKKLGPPRGQN